MRTWVNAMQITGHTDIKEDEFHRLYDKYKNGLLTKEEYPRWLAGWLKSIYGVERLSSPFVEQYVEKAEMTKYLLHNKLVHENEDGRVTYMPTKDILRMMKRDHIRKSAVVQVDVIDQDYERIDYIARFLDSYGVDLTRALSSNCSIPADKMEFGNIRFLLLLEEKLDDVNRLFGTKMIGKKDAKITDNRVVMPMLNALLKVVGLKVKSEKRGNHRKSTKAFNIERHFEYGKMGHPRLQPYFTKMDILCSGKIDQEMAAAVHTE